MTNQQDMAKIRIKSEKHTHSNVFFLIVEYINSKLSSVIDIVLGLRCKSFGYQYSEIICLLMCMILADA